MLAAARLNVCWARVELTEASEVAKVIGEISPELIFHLLRVKG